MEKEAPPTPQKIPWQLIAFSFQGLLDKDGLRQLAEWVCTSPANQDQYEEWHRLWQQMVAKDEL